MAITQQKRLELIALFNTGWTCTNIADKLGISISTVSNQTEAAIESGEINSLLNLRVMHPDIEPTDYTGHSELNKHYAGAEYEDDRHPELRGRDWPFKFQINQKPQIWIIQ